MGQAQRQPDDVPTNKREDVVVRARREYADALHRAEISATHTATDGWQQLYTGFRLAQREARRKLADDLRQVADTIEAGNLSEDGEKRIGDLKKAAIDLRETAAVFDAKTVQPVKDPVEECRRIMADANTAAQNDEARTPLVNIGLAETMLMESRTWDVPTWDADTGRVNIIAPTTEGINRAIDKIRSAGGVMLVPLDHGMPIADIPNIDEETERWLKSRELFTVGQILAACDGDVSLSHLETLGGEDKLSKKRIKALAAAIAGR